MTMTGLAVGVMNAIYHRRSVRSFAPTPVEAKTLHELLEAAIQAPTAQHEEPWEFVVIEDRAVLKQISEQAKIGLKERLGERTGLSPLHDMTAPDFNIFYDAGTLVLICSRMTGQFVAADCWLAAENLMLAAHAMGLGSCVIGSALAALNSDFKAELGIPADMVVHVALIVGYPRVSDPAPSPRKTPMLYKHILPSGN